MASLQQRLVDSPVQVVTAGGSTTAIGSYHSTPCLETDDDGISEHADLLSAIASTPGNVTDLVTITGLQLTEEQGPSDRIVQQMLRNRALSDSQDSKGYHFRGQGGSLLHEIKLASVFCEADMACSGILQYPPEKPASANDANAWPYPYIRFNAAQCQLGMKKASATVALRLDCRDADWRRSAEAEGTENVGWGSRYTKGTATGHGEPDAPLQSMNRANMWVAPDAPRIWARPIGGTLKRPDSFTYKKVDRMTKFTLEAGKSGNVRSDFVDLFNEDFCSENGAPEQQCITTGVVARVLEQHDMQKSATEVIRGASVQRLIPQECAALLREYVITTLCQFAQIADPAVRDVIATVRPLWFGTVNDQTLWLKANLASLADTVFRNPARMFSGVTIELPIGPNPGPWSIKLAGGGTGPDAIRRPFVSAFGLIGNSTASPSQQTAVPASAVYDLRVRPIIGRAAATGSWAHQASGLVAGSGVLFANATKSDSINHLDVGKMTDADQIITLLGCTHLGYASEPGAIGRLAGWAVNCHNHGASALFESDDAIERDVSDWDDSDDFFTNFFTEVD
jgi:hypothetical protein